ncbi:MAG: glycoside hydrolase family 97 protein [Candidatus Marinimicrobia bacterium]|nr:glycoside hydrolase family 97 protein [Candidatus Neomarinimicrobiota bacterium]
MKKSILIFLSTVCFLWGNSYKISSPNNFLEAIVNVDKIITYELTYNQQKILNPSQIALQTASRQLGPGATVSRVQNHEIDMTLRPVVREKSKEIRDHYRELTLFFNEFNLIFRAYNHGFAYRFVTEQKEEQTIVNETIEYNFPANYNLWFPEEESMYSHQEREYKYLSLEEIGQKFCSIPTLIDGSNNIKIFISESALFDYPGFYLTGKENGLKAIFPKYPKTTRQTSDRDVIITETENFLAKTEGTRKFPWRLMIIGEDKEIAESQLVYQLAGECRLKDTDWIRPGKVAWDWWNALNIRGVDFESGVNTATYKYYMDFASTYGLEYIILDEGWYDLKDLMKVNPDVDMNELSRYSKQTGVGLILWTTWKALDDKLDEALDQFEKWGIKGIKVDFMQRDDQWMVQYYEKIAREAARRKMLVDFHGSYKPAGLRRTYPNVITREGVRGLEQAKWSDWANPEWALILPFTRNVAGPMDYTPGGMRNTIKSNFHPTWSKPMTLGTRCQQLAMYIVYGSPLQMLADNPSHYYAEPACMEFLSAVPTVWDDTIVLQAKVGDYIVTVRQSGREFYLGSMTDWTARDFDIKLDFLGKGKYQAIIYQDGINADKNAEDFKQTKKEVTAGDLLKIHLAPGGGFAARFVPAQ